jgi:hypothetical protein
VRLLHVSADGTDFLEFDVGDFREERRRKKVEKNPNLIKI